MFLSQSQRNSYMRIIFNRPLTVLLFVLTVATCKCPLSTVGSAEYHWLRVYVIVLTFNAVRVFSVNEGLPTTTRSGSARTPPLGFYNQDTSYPSYKTGAGVTRDPWWWSYPHLRPYSVTSYPYRSFIPSYSYLSPVKRSYVWNTRPHRPYSQLTTWLYSQTDVTGKTMKID